MRRIGTAVYGYASARGPIPLTRSANQLYASSFGAPGAAGHGAGGPGLPDGQERQEPWFGRAGHGEATTELEDWNQRGWAGPAGSILPGLAARLRSTPPYVPITEPFSGQVERSRAPLQPNQ